MKFEIIVDEISDMMIDIRYSTDDFFMADGLHGEILGLIINDLPFEFNTVRILNNELTLFVNGVEQVRYNINEINKIRSY